MINLTILFLFFTNMNSTIHNYSIESLNRDSEISLSEYTGKKILIVNVASKCGFTPQYKDLQKLYELYSDKLVVLGIPCNQFLRQEPGSEALIAEFCSSNYGVTFPMTTKVDVKGKDQHPIYKWLTQKELNGKGDYKVSWNFNKFLIDEEGNLIEYFASGVNPLSQEITKYLE